VVGHTPIVRRCLATPMHFASRKDGKQRAIYQCPPDDAKELRGQLPRSWTFVVGGSGLQPMASYRQDTLV
jgi:hypothetical protein